MAIDRTGIDSLEAGASSIKLEGDVRPGAAKLYAMPEEMKMADLDNIPGWWLQDLDELIQEYIEDTGGDKPRTLNDLEKWHRWKYDQTQAPETEGPETMTAAQGGIAGYRGGGSTNPRLMPHTGADLLAKKNSDGTRSKYQWQVHTGRADPAPTSGGARPDPGPQNVHQTGAVSQTPSTITARTAAHEDLIAASPATTNLEQMARGVVETDPRYKTPVSTATPTGLLPQSILNRRLTADQLTEGDIGLRRLTAEQAAAEPDPYFGYDYSDDPYPGLKNVYDDRILRIAEGVEPGYRAVDERPFGLTKEVALEKGKITQDQYDATPVLTLDRLQDPPPIVPTGDGGTDGGNGGGIGGGTTIVPATGTGITASTDFAAAKAAAIEAAKAEAPFKHYAVRADASPEERAFMQAHRAAPSMVGLEQYAADGGRIGYGLGGLGKWITDLFRKEGRAEARAPVSNGNGEDRLREWFMTESDEDDDWNYPWFKAHEGGRAGYAGGGISDLRQGYFVGKLVKKAKRAVKKVLKSPVGQIAAAYLMYQYGPKMFGEETWGGAWKKAPAWMRGRELGPDKPGLNIFQRGLASIKDNPWPWIMGASAVGGLTAEEEEGGGGGGGGGFDRGPGIDIPGIRSKVLGRRGTREEFPYLPTEYYANQAQGGRIGLQGGGRWSDPGMSPGTRSDYTPGQGHRENVGRPPGGGDPGMTYTPPPTPLPRDGEGGGKGLFSLDNVLHNKRLQQDYFKDKIKDLRLRKKLYGEEEENEYITPEIWSAGDLGFKTDDTSDLTQEQVDKDPERYAQLLISLRSPDRITGEHGNETAFYIQPDGTHIAVPWGYSAGNLDYYPQNLIGWEAHNKAQGGRIGAQEGGLMDLGGMEKDYRQEGGFVPIGGQEKADDVPARLSKNEFVFTADAVRAAGGGDIDAGAEVMENVMENLEQGGQVSEESQGLEGARNMFATAQRLGGVI